MESHDPSVACSYVITWETKTIISPLSRCLWWANFGGWWLATRGLHPQSSMTLSSRCLVRSQDKLKPLYLQCNIKWQCDDLPWGASIHKVQWAYYHVVLRNHVTNDNHYISTTIIYRNTKLDRVMTHLKGLLLKKSQDPQSCGLVGLQEKAKLLYLNYHDANGVQTWEGGDLTWGASIHKGV